MQFLVQAQGLWYGKAQHCEGVAKIHCMLDPPKAAPYVCISFSARAG